MKNKTPAVLLYYEDFLTGTQEMTDEEVGQYIRLLCYQNAKGHISKAFIDRVVPTVKEYVLDKFTKDEDGKYYNERMEAEIARRVRYSESRSKNRKTHDKDMFDISTRYEEHMETETETVNSNSNKDKREADEKLAEIRRKVGLI